LFHTILDELDRRAEMGERRKRRERKERGEPMMRDGEERRADKTKSGYSHRWGESLHVVTGSFV
jgi:hypothetical protein